MSRLGGAPMRDADLLAWCTDLLTDLASAPPVGAVEARTLGRA